MIKNDLNGNPVQVALRTFQTDNLLSATKIAKKCNVAPSQITRILNGENLPFSDLFARLCVECKFNVKKLVKELAEFHKKDKEV
jgi:transcriptional regulator with XRE-family HTH domain